MLTPSKSELVAELRRIVHAAGDIIMVYYGGDIAVRDKADSSPVTDADEASERLIVDALRALTPDAPVVAEELFAAGHAPRLDSGPFWLVDPLDGTKEYIARNGEFTVNIALVEDGRPVVGIVHAPAIGVTYFTDASGKAFVEKEGGPAKPIRARRPDPRGLVAALSRSHRTPETDRFLADYMIKAERTAGSALKFGVVASGEADIYPRLGRTWEWDTAAGHAVVTAAGGSVRTLDGDELRYGKPGLLNPEFVVRGLDA